MSKVIKINRKTGERETVLEGVSEAQAMSYAVRCSMCESNRDIIYITA